MKQSGWVVSLLVVALVGCGVSTGGGSGPDGGVPDGGSDAAAPDAAHGDSDQVTTCDVSWGVQLCDFACAVEPANPINGQRCADPSRPCYSGRACTAATTPYGEPHDCAATFLTANGTRGCCAERVVATPQHPTPEIPTFYACP